MGKGAARGRARGGRAVRTRTDLRVRGRRSVERECGVGGGYLGAKGT